MKQFQPYYTVNESIGSEQVSRFLHDFSQGVPGLDHALVKKVLEDAEANTAENIEANPCRNQGSGSSPCRTPSGAEQEEA